MRFVCVTSLQMHGIAEQLVRIEALCTRGLSQILLTGLPDTWLRDSKEKIRTLVQEHGDWGPVDRLLVHLLPAEINKAGAHLELPIVVACLAALHARTLSDDAKKFLLAHPLVGSLNLQGELCHTELSAALEDSDPERIIGPGRFRSLRELWAYLLAIDTAELPPHTPSATTEAPPPALTETCKGRYWERFWLLASSVAELPVLLIGPPGAGKSFLARWAHRLLPAPSRTQSLEQRRIWGLSGLRLLGGAPLLTPHSRTHLSEFIGVQRGGMARPGLFSLAHGGLLVLDEFVELNRDCRETLRTILDHKEIMQNTRAGNLVWPARFWLIATSNPCPCGGARGEDLSSCRCAPQSKDQYKARLSGPVLDRFGIRLFVSGSGEKDEQQSRVETFLGSQVLDADPEFLRSLVKESRFHVIEHIEKAQIEMARWPNFNKLSVRGRANKARLLAAMQVICPERTLAELCALLATYLSLEYSLSNSQEAVYA